MAMVVIGSLCLAVALMLLLPFFRGTSTELCACATVNDPGELAAEKRAVLQRYLRDEQAFAKGFLTQREWDQRREFLTDRYVDLAARADFVGGQV